MRPTTPANWRSWSTAIAVYAEGYLNLRVSGAMAWLALHLPALLQMEVMDLESVLLGW